MADAFEEQAVLVAAEQAAAEGDTIAAEGHLRTLLELQTARLGPEHEEVASTLHNLAVVCERAGRLTDAEGLYRRAFAVASASLPATDSLVVRCRDDLNAFLDARMMPLQTMRPPEAADATPTFQAPARAAPSSGVRPPSESSPPSATRKPAPSGVRAAGPSAPASGVRQPAPSSASRQPARPASRARVPPPPPRSSSAIWLAAAVAAVLIAIGVVWATRTREPAPTAATTPAAAPAAKRPPAKKATPAPSAPATPGPSSAPATPAIEPAPSAAPAEAPPAEPPPAEPPAADAPARSRGADGGISVTDARLCRDLSTRGAWVCQPAEPPVAPGRLYFLTRLDVPTTMEVVHRWYHGDEVVQTVNLRVPAAGQPGYRTYSRQTVDAGRTGAWRVELRSADGAVLAEERFTVQ
jgi:hypothetical protein